MLNFPELDLSKKKLLSEIRRLREINKELSYENQNLKNSLITIRKSSREKLQQQKDDNDEQFKLMIEAIPVSIVISKINGEILYLNKTAIQTFGLPEKNLSHYNTNQFYGNTDDRKKIIKLFTKQGFVKNQEVQVKKYNGISFGVNANIRAFKYENQPALLSLLFDLTELKETSKQRDKLIDQYLDILYLFNLSLDLLCIANFEGYFVRLNPAWENILGYSLAELVKIPYLDLVHPEDQENTFKEAKKLTQGINTIEFENRYRCKDGSYRWFLWTATPVLETGLIYCVAHDITERKKSEQNLHQSREEMRLITDNLPVCISYIDNQRCYLFINQTYETWFNHKKEEVIGKYLWDILGQEFYEQEAKKYVDQVLQGEQIRYETQITFAEGITRYVEGKLIPDYDENQQIRGYFCVITDLSDRRQQEELLRIAKENYQQIFENASEGIFQSSYEGKYLKVNPALAKIHGYSLPEEMINQITDIATQIYVDSNKRKEFQVILDREGSVKNFQYEAYRKDGIKIWLEENTRVVYNSQGELLYYEGIVQDITKRKQEEELLKQELKRLRIEIDQNKRQGEVNQITKSDYFQKIKSEIDQLRLEQ